MESLNRVPEEKTQIKKLPNQKENILKNAKEKSIVPKVSDNSLKSKKPTKSTYNFPFGYKMKHSELVFQVNGDYPDVIKELKQRNWRNYETNPGKITFLWSNCSKITKQVKDILIINHLININEIVTKDKLCENLKIISKTFFPECYSIIDGDFSEFSHHFYESYLESQLKFIEKLDMNDPEISEILLSCSSSPELKLLIDKNGLCNKNSILAYLNIGKNDPQYRIRGENNLWIVKPGKMSRGRGIKVMKDLNSMRSYANEGTWVIQKYIEIPLLINSKKFDIRQWVLITNNTNFNLYFYNRCYLRFSSENYDISDTENLFMHLTNNSIVKYSTNFVEEESMWHSETFQKWIIEETGEDHWEKIVEKMKNIVKCTVGEVKSKINKRRMSFEVLGYDFMIDQDFNPWLIEINTCPAMDYSTVMPT